MKILSERVLPSDDPIFAAGPQVFSIRSWTSSSKHESDRQPNAPGHSEPITKDSDPSPAKSTPAPSQGKR